MNSEDLDAQRGSEALMELRHRKTDGPSDELFDRVVTAATGNSNDRTSKQRFWM